MKNDIFIFGAQYYRAPTPEKSNWENDIRQMKKLGFNSVKFWVQWRWTHRGENEFYFEDIDNLMDIAYENGLRVTINIIFDVAPIWLYKKYPNAKQVTADGEIIEPQSAGHRQIGGFPGPCYNHDGAKKERVKFLEETVKRYSNHPALDMWDVWNEPEQCGLYREPKLGKLTCYCDNCRKKFINKMLKKYGTIAELNKVWGKCYSSPDEIETPKNGSTFADFIDYREFMLDTMTEEANLRIETVKKIDKKHIVYLHTVPNTSSVFNSLTGVDDFAMSENCDVFASTNFAQPIWSILTKSAAQSKTAYNVECHIGSGSIGMHQRQISYEDLVHDLVPQLGMGIKGFMFWQYRPETLGIESPAWGTANLDGSEGCIYKAAEKFNKEITPIIPEIMRGKPQKPKIAIWKSRKNEIFNFCVKDNLKEFSAAYENYVNAIYYSNYDCIVVDDNIIEQNKLDGISLLIMPICYALTEETANGIVRALENGTSVLCEAHLGGYNINSGRHSLEMPGCGLSRLLGIKEKYTTSPYHLKKSLGSDEIDLSAASDDVKKAAAAYGFDGGKYFPIELENGCLLYGAERFAALEGENINAIGKFGQDICIASKKYKNGTIYYCGSNIANGSDFNRNAFVKFLNAIISNEKIEKNFIQNTPYGVHIDVIGKGLISVNNTTDEPFTFDIGGKGQGVFFDGKSIDNKFTVQGNTAEIIQINL